jgi:hypothetical protein
MRTGQIGLIRMLFLLVLMVAGVAAIIFVERGTGGSRCSTPSASSAGGCTAARARTSR